MKDLIEIQEKLFPEVVTIMQRRYKILHYIKNLQPIGRRSLADSIDLKERIVRSETEFLSAHGFIVVTAKGMRLTEDGSDMVEKLHLMMSEISEFRVLESQIKDKLQLDHVIVVPGNTDEQQSVKKALGKACAQFLSKIITSDQTIAVTGGTSMAEVAEEMNPLPEAMNCTFVPARGGLGEQVENQANTICAQMAKKANGNYRMLYVPDPLSEDTYHTIIEEPAIKEILELIHDANIILHGIGDALTMAKRRKTSQDILDHLTKSQAVSEAFGYYLDHEGNVVYKVRTAGMQLEDLEHADYVIAVAGGTSKVEAIKSYFEQGKSNVLITDEAVANELLKGTSL
ncbi:transcription regulator CggR [Gracilibacillus halophilus YIM-C55.5]|uniref:Transcription regulator CggR n=1 Tax=Gracilibacillus halophilus YIM-C55.5 TaxID=1308866 RepID=N4WL55_9BACI|nr:sugar-binding domain-containing protein [Gracilibacillus halophilus]ENH96912.1 transcription regulator CggR [Gracilibacillus halophilus YIM-C55.5]